MLGKRDSAPGGLPSLKLRRANPSAALAKGGGPHDRSGISEPGRYSKRDLAKAMSSAISRSTES
jgi:hypothetical protein